MNQSPRIEINPSMVTWALKRASVTIAEIEREFPKIREWESGDSMPTLNQLENLGKRTLTPFGFFFLSAPPKETIPLKDFRTLGSKKVVKIPVELRDTIYTMQIRQEWLREYFLENEYDPVDLVSSVSVRDEPIVVAENIFQQLKIKKNWYSDVKDSADALALLQARIENVGIAVMKNSILGLNSSRPLDLNVFRGFALVDKIAPLIFVNSRDSKPAQVFTLIHEFCHILLGESGISLIDFTTNQGVIETFCNRVSAEFLAPARVINVQNFKGKENLPRFIDSLGQQLKVSGSVIAYRAFDLGKISKSERDEYIAIASTRKSLSKNNGGTFLTNQTAKLGRMFGGAVASAAKSGKLRYTDAYRLTGCNGKSFDAYVKSALPLMR